ncbi:MAG: DUF3300 domain-containing protein [Steroidobacteraceae bacterium]
MKIRALGRRKLAIAIAFGIVTALAGCGSKEEPTATTTAVPPPTAAPEAAPAAAASSPITAADVASATWTPEALEELLAPIALYPDPVLSQVLIASTNPQEVLDAGNWLIANESLKGKALDDGAAQAGFTPPIRALVQFPQTIDMMCMELGWTTELGQAFVADQAGVLDAVQRLRKQAMDVGNLQSSEAMKVETEVQEGKEVIVLSPPKPEIVYVPTYDPQAVYAPAPAAPAAAPAATTTTTTTTEKTGYSTSAMVTTGLLAFGAGILVNELFDDDDHHNGYYYPNYGYGGMPYYPPYPYRPSYGGGYYPSNGYNRPPNYNSGFQNNGNIYVNTGGGNNRPGNNNNYWNNYDNKPRQGGNNNGYNKPRKSSSPITQAKPNRSDLNDLNKRQPRPMPADVKRPSSNTTASTWKGQQSYAGKDKRPASAQSPQDRINSATPGYSKPASTARPPSAQNRTPPKVQGSYAGKDMPNRPSTQNVPKPAAKPAARPASKPVAKPQNMPSGDRGYGGGGAQQPSPRPSAQPAQMNRPSPSAQPRPSKPTAVSGASRGGGGANAASQRGKQSMPQGARSKGGGGNKKAR